MGESSDVGEPRVEELEVPVGRVGRGRRSGQAVLALWGVGLVAVIGLANLGSSLGRPAAPSSSVSPAPSPKPERAAPPWVADLAPIVVTFPPQAATATSRRTLRVSGYSVPPVARVEVRLLIPGSRIVARSDFPRGSPAPFGSTTRQWFTTRFRLADPRPSGTLAVLVIGYDASGRPLDAVRREVEVGPVVERAPGFGRVRGSEAVAR